MQRREVKITIIEDDNTLGRALTEAARQAGFQAMHYNRPDDALGVAQLAPPTLYVIDCMLPKMSGVNLASKLRSVQSSEIPIIFTSGIYKDKSFIREAVDKTNAKGFLVKPFTVEEFIGEIEKIMGSQLEADVPLDPLSEIITLDSITPNVRLKAIEAIKSIQGYELPRILGLLMNPSVNGVAKLNEASGNDPIRIHFANGNITKVEMKMPNSLFGALLVERNLVSPEDLQKVLDMPRNKSIGESLVEASLLSPHLIQLINGEQIGLRLGKVISDTNYDFSFQPGKVYGEPLMQPDHLLKLNQDWVLAKIPTSWLKTAYLPWLDHVVRVTSEFNDRHPICMWSMVGRLQHILTKLKSGMSTLSAIINAYAQLEDEIYQVIHVFVNLHLIHFDKGSRVGETADLLDRLKRISKTIETQNHFEVLGINKASKGPEIKKSYLELAKIFHPDKLPTGVSEEIRVLNQKIFSRMTQAHDILKDEKAKESYLKELEKGQASKIIESEELLEKGKHLLASAQYAKALELFDRARSLRTPTSELNLYCTWSKLMMAQSLSDPRQKDKVVEEVEKILAKMPPEDRHSALYYFAKGLFLKLTGQFELAKSSFKNALFMNPTFKEALREMNMLEHYKKNSNAQAGSIIGAIFKKKK